MYSCQDTTTIWKNKTSLSFSVLLFRGTFLPLSFGKSGGACGEEWEEQEYVSYCITTACQNPPQTTKGQGRKGKKERKKLTGTILTHDVKKIFFSSQVIVDWT